MSDKKNIDRLFQESFKNFEATPSDVVWNNIEAKLRQKNKERKVVPIWWRYAGVAALLLLLLTVGIGYFNEDPNVAPPLNQVVENEDTTPSNSSEKNKIPENKSTNSVATENNDVFKPHSNKGIDQENTLNNASVSKVSKLAETSFDKNKDDIEQKTNLFSKTTSNSIAKTIKNNAVAYGSEGKNKHVIQDETSKIPDASKEILDSKTTNNSVTADNIEKENTSLDTAKAEHIINNIKKDDAALAASENADNKEKNNTLTIEDVLEETKNNIEKEERMNRWSITPNAAPVYFNTLSEGSSIGSEFNNNAKTSETNMSYGITASYAVNKRLSIRSGVNKVNLGYKTNDVFVFETLASSSVSSLLSGSTSIKNNASVNTNISENVTLVSASNFEPSEVPKEFASNSITSINQSISYIEIPLEVQYALSDKKLGINLIGGFSSFFLNGNELSSPDQGRVNHMEATNINNVSYSANLGLGFQYKFSKKLNLNLEPMFKYQINTFNNTSGNFTPYFIGVYTGIGFKF